MTKDSLGDLPSPLSAAIREACGHMTTQLGPKLGCLLLCGSFARGEGSYLWDGKTLKIFSDVELFLLFRGLVKPDREELERAAGRWFRDFATPLFHVGVALFPAWRVATLDRRLFFFETRAYGVSLAGNPRLVAKIPRVNLANLDFVDLNDVVVHRLYSIMSNLYMLSSRDDQLKPLLMRYVLARNLLDVPTVFLPYAGYLIAGYRDRLAFLKGKAHQIAVVQVFDQDFIDVMDHCFEVKKRPDVAWSMALHELHEATVRYFECLIRYISKWGSRPAGEILMQEGIRLCQSPGLRGFLRRRLKTIRTGCRPHGILDNPAKLGAALYEILRSLRIEEGDVYFPEMIRCANGLCASMEDIRLAMEDFYGYS